jgi:hypothetical protein
MTYLHLTQTIALVPQLTAKLQATLAGNISSLALQCLTITTTALFWSFLP